MAGKFHLGLARAGFEASVYGQIGNAIGLLAGAAGLIVYGVTRRFGRDHAKAPEAA